MNWVGFAIGSAFFAGLTAILGKLGVEGLNSNLATFIRTIVILFVVIAIITMRNEWQLPQHIAAKPVVFFGSVRCGNRAFMVMLLPRLTISACFLGGAD